MRSISFRSLTRRKVAMTPSVTPLCGSTSISGMGMKGATAGSSQRMRPVGLAGAEGASRGAAGTPGATAGASCAGRLEAPASIAATATAPTAGRASLLRRRRINAPTSVRRVPAVGPLEACGAARAGDVPGDGWNGRKRRADRAAGVRIMLVRQIVGEQRQLPGPCTAGQGHTGIRGPIGRLIVEIVDDVELDLVLPHVVGAQQQIAGGGGNQVAAAHVPLQSWCLVKLVMRKILQRRRRRTRKCRRLVQERLIARIGPAESGYERDRRGGAPERLELGAADACLAGVRDQGDGRARSIQLREQPLHVVVLAIEHSAVEAERTTQQVGLQADLVVGELLGLERLIVQ